VKIFALLLSIFVINWASLVQAADIEELKGAYLINFIKFARFEQKLNEILVCVPGGSQLYDYLKEKLPDSINESKISLKQMNDKDDINSCNILYISRLGGQATNNTALTITDQSGGGVFEFVELDDRLRFTVDLSKATRVKVTFPVQVLNLAVRKDSLSFNEEVPSIRIGFNKGVNSYAINSTFDNCSIGWVLPNISTMG
jgi:hypothetical protein